MKRLIILFALAPIFAVEAQAQTLVLEVPQSTHTCVNQYISSGTATQLSGTAAGEYMYVAVDNEDTAGDLIRCSEKPTVACSGAARGMRVANGQLRGWTLPKKNIPWWFCISCKASPDTDGHPATVCRAR